MIAIISAMGGGFLGSLLQSFLLNSNASKERQFQKEQADAERNFRSDEAQKEWERKEAKMREDRYFQVKIEAYLPLVKALTFAIADLNDQAAVIKCLELANESLLFFGDDARKIMKKMETINPDDNDARRLLLVKLTGALRRELDIHHSGKFEQSCSFGVMVSVKSIDTELD
jgi:hypothetical protein